MVKSRFQLLKWLLLLPLLVGALEAQEVVVNTQDGEMFVFDMEPEETIHDLEEKVIALQNGKNSSFLVEITTDTSLIGFNVHTSRSQGGYLGYPRNYYADVSPTEKSDIHYIVTSLANKSLISIAFIKGELEDAGNRIDHLHPLKFLLAIFLDEELKVGIRNIRGKGWVWNHFTGGLKDCLSTEASIGNMEDDYVTHFAQTLKIDPNLVLPSIHQQNWDELIDLLITHIPRKGDHDRYDCRYRHL